jgi:hypothetical protein
VKEEEATAAAAAAEAAVGLFPRSECRSVGRQAGGQQETAEPTSTRWRWSWWRRLRRRRRRRLSLWRRRWRRRGADWQRSSAALSGGGVEGPRRPGADHCRSRRWWQLPLPLSAPLLLALAWWQCRTARTYPRSSITRYISHCPALPVSRPPPTLCAFFRSSRGPAIAPAPRLRRTFSLRPYTVRVRVCVCARARACVPACVRAREPKYERDHRVLTRRKCARKLRIGARSRNFSPSEKLRRRRIFPRSWLYL